MLPKKHCLPIPRAVIEPTPKCLKPALFVDAFMRLQPKRAMEKEMNRTPGLVSTKVSPEGKRSLLTALLVDDEIKIAERLTSEFAHHGSAIEICTTLDTAIIALGTDLSLRSSVSAKAVVSESPLRLAPERL